MPDGGIHTLEVPYGPLADIQVQFLAERDIERPHALSHGGHQRTFYPDEEVFEGLEGRVREEGPVPVERGSACIHFHPVYAPFLSVGGGYCGVCHLPAYGGYFSAHAVSRDEGDRRDIGYGEFSAGLCYSSQCSCF